MAFPGGRKEREDENLIRTAMREAQEEIGVRLTDVKVLGEILKAKKQKGENELVKVVSAVMPILIK